MKQTSRILMALLLTATMLFGSVVFGYGATEDAVIGSEILPESNIQSVIDFNSNKIAYDGDSTINQTLVVNPESEGLDNIYYMDTDLYVERDPATGMPLMKPTHAEDYQYLFDMFSGNGRFYADRVVTGNVPGKSADDTCLQFFYDPAASNNGQRVNWASSDLSILTQKFVSEKIPSQNKVTYVNMTYDYVEVTFDLFFHNPEANFLISLENDSSNESAKFYLMIIDTEGNVYLRESSGSPSMEISSFDRKIGQVALDSWNTFSIAFYPHKGTVGYYDYWISINGTEATRDGTTTFMSSVVDNASFLNQQTKIKFSMGISEKEPTALTYWALDNVMFESFDYLNEPDDVDTRLPQMDFELQEENVINQFGDALAGVSPALDGDNQIIDSTYSLNISGAHLHLSKTAIPALAEQQLKEYFLDFDIYGKLPLTMELYGASFAMPDGVLKANQWNTVSLRVEISGENRVKVQVGGINIAADFVPEEEPTFSIFPGEGAGTVKVRNFALRFFQNAGNFDSIVTGMTPVSGKEGVYGVDMTSSPAAVVDFSQIPGLAGKELKNYIFSFEVFGKQTVNINVYGQKFVVPKSLLANNVWNTVTLQVSVNDANKVSIKMNGQTPSGSFTYSALPTLSILATYKASDTAPIELRNLELRVMGDTVSQLDSQVIGLTEQNGEYTMTNPQKAGIYLHLYKSALPALLNDRVNNFFTLSLELYGDTYSGMQFYGEEFAIPAGILKANQWNTLDIIVTISEHNTIDITVNAIAVSGNFTFDVEPVLCIYSNGNGMAGEMVRNLVLTEQVYSLKSEKETQNVTVWNSSFMNANGIINMGDTFTTINGSNVLQFDKVAGATSRDPQYQVQGSYANDSFSLTLREGGFAVKGEKVNLLLYRKNGNTYLSGDRVADTFTVSFEVFGNPDLSISLYGKSLGVPGLVADQWNQVTVYVAPYNETQDMVRVVCNGETRTEQITRAENPVLSFVLPAGIEVKMRNIQLVEVVEKDVYYVTIGGEKVVLSEARTNYLRYLWEKRFTSRDVKPFEYGTVDRRAVRPVGEVAFDTDTYYHKYGVTVASWGSTVTPAVACDVNYWMSNKSSLDENGNETNTYLTGCADIYMENAAVVTQVYAQGTNGKTDIWHTSGVQFNFFKKDGVKSMKQDYISEYFRVSLSFWYDSVTFPDAGAEYRFGAENSVSEHTTDTDTLGSRYMTGQVMFRVETTDAGPRLIIPTDRYGVAKEGDAGYRTVADDNYMLTQVTPSKNANGDYRTFDSHMFVTNPLADALPEGESTLSVELQDGWNTLELEFKKVHSATARDVRNNDDGSTTTFEMNHHIFEVRYAVNGDYVTHSDDPEYGDLFYFDNGIDPSSQHMYMQITAPLHSVGTEMPNELERTKYRSLKLEFLHDGEIDVNSYEKGGETEDVIRYTDFEVNIEDDLVALAEAQAAIEAAKAALAAAKTSSEKFQKENELRRAEKAYSDLLATVTRRMVYAKKNGNVTFVDRNDRLLVNHLENNSVGEVLYTFAEGEIGDVMTFDFSLYRGLVYDGSSAQTKNVDAPEIEVFVGDRVVMTIDRDGVVRTSGVVAQCKESGWNNISVCLEKANGGYVLTAYVNGEIVSFRIVTDVTSIPSVGVRTKGNEGDACRLDNMAVSVSNIPTGVIYMHPITYVTNGGEMAYDAGAGYHIVGSKEENLPLVGHENALFDGWYFDEGFTSKAKMVRVSYTKPVVLYAKYNYLVTYAFPEDAEQLEAKPPRSSVSFGEIAIPQISGLVEYWYAEVNGRDVYLKGGEMYNVQTNVDFVAVLANGKAKADFAVSVLNIDLSDRYENIAEATKKAEALYSLLTDEEKLDSQVVKYRGVLDGTIAAEMKAREDLAKVYLEWFAVLEDKNASYDERLEAYRQMDVYIYENNLDGKTFRDYVDMTVPGVWEANSDLATHSRTLEKAKDACLELVMAVEGYKRAQAAGNVSTMLQKFTYASLIAKAYNTCMSDLLRHAVETYDELAASDFADVELRDNEEDNLKYKPLSDEELLEGGITAYLAEAKGMMDSYNDTASTINGDLLGAHQVADSFTTGVYYGATNGKVPAAVMALLDRMKEQLDALMGRS